MTRLSEEGVLVRIFIGETDKYKGKPLFEQIVFKARELGMAGATVCKGIMGFGAHSHLRFANILRLSEDLPIIIEIVDKQENIDKIIPFLDEAVDEGLITMEKVKVLKYIHRK